MEAGSSTHDNATTSGCAFPVPVSFDDDTPTADFCRIVLTVDGVAVRRPVIGRARATNAVITPTFTGGVVSVDVVVTDNQVNNGSLQ